MRGGVPLAACALIVGLPFMFLWRTYRKAVPGLVSAQMKSSCRADPWTALSGSQWA
jgi:hypothetical protein